MQSFKPGRISVLVFGFLLGSAMGQFSNGGGGAGSFYTIVQDEGSSLTQRTILDFAGAGVTCADVSSKTRCTIPGGGGGGSTTTSGDYASLPAMCTDGDQYWTTDSDYQFLCASAAQVPFLYGRQATLPGLVSGWTAVNAGSEMTATDTNGSINLTITNNAGTNTRFLSKVQPSTPYVLTYYMEAQLLFNLNFSGYGAYFYDGTKWKAIQLGGDSTRGFYIRILQGNTVTTETGAITFGPQSIPIGRGLWFQLENDGADLNYRWSIDGNVWNTLLTEAVGAFLTPTQYGFGGYNINGSTDQRISISLKSLVIQ